MTTTINTGGLMQFVYHKDNNPKLSKKKVNEITKIYEDLEKRNLEKLEQRQLNKIANKKRNWIIFGVIIFGIIIYLIFN